MSDPTPPAWFGPVFPIVFVAFWLFILNVLASIGGWRQLARSYRATDRATGQRFLFRSANIGQVNYGSCLRFVSGPAGLFVAVQLPFRPAHPPLFIPWSEVAASNYRGWIFQYVDFVFQKQPAVRMRI